MGQTVPVRQQFLPRQIAQIDQHATMTKIWTYDQQNDVLRQIDHLQHIKLTQESFQCKIQAIHRQFLNEQNKWKIIVIFQYFPTSLRQQIISRKKQNSYRVFFTERQLQSILNLLGFFVFKYYNYLCSHSDIFSSIFLCGKQYKICHPQLLPNRCQNALCDKSQMKYKLMDSILELMLLQKIVKADYRHKHRAQRLYTHAAWLIELLNDMMDSTSELLDICKKSELVRLYFCGQRTASSPKRIDIENVRESTYSAVERQLLPQINEENRLETQEQMHYRSQSVQLLSQKPNNKKISNLLGFENRYNLLSLENYQRELVQSIGGDLEESSLLPIDHVRENSSLHQEQTREVNLLMEQSSEQQETKFNEHNKSVHSALPMTIFEEENQNNSQDSRKHLGQNSLVLSEDDEYRYEGDLVHGKKHGKGTIVYNNGAYYSGEWRNDQMNGFGTLYYASGNPQYIGEWKNNKFNGKGSYFNQNPDFFDGSFNYRDFDELGRRWKSCEGEFKDDMMEGRGVLTLSNGEFLQAQWHKNLLNGEGVFITLENKKIKGLWLDNKLFSCEIQDY